MEKLNEFFRVKDMFDFDNLGFTNTVDNLKVDISLSSYSHSIQLDRNLQVKGTYLRFINNELKDPALPVEKKMKKRKK